MLKMPFINWQISEFEYSYLCSNRYLQLFQQLNTMFYESFTSFWLMREEHVRALIEWNAKPSLIYPIVQRLWSYENLLTFISMILKVKQWWRMSRKPSTIDITSDEVDVISRWWMIIDRETGIFRFSQVLIC